MNYQTTRYTETLPKYTEKNFFQECSNPDITHVVTSVTYGLNAIFVFSKEIQSHETDDMVTGDMKLAINKVVCCFYVFTEGKTWVIFRSPLPVLRERAGLTLPIQTMNTWRVSLSTSSETSYQLNLCQLHTTRL